MPSNTEWPTAEEKQTRHLLASFYAIARGEAEEGALAARGATSRQTATTLVINAATRAAEHYSFLRGLLSPALLLPPEPYGLAVVTNLMLSELLELAALHDELATQAEQRGETARAETRRARSSQLRALAGEAAP